MAQESSRDAYLTAFLEQQKAEEPTSEPSKSPPPTNTPLASTKPSNVSKGPGNSSQNSLFDYFSLQSNPNSEPIPYPLTTFQDISKGIVKGKKLREALFKCTSFFSKAVSFARGIPNVRHPTPKQNLEKQRDDFLEYGNLFVEKYLSKMGSEFDKVGLDSVLEDDDRENDVPKEKREEQEEDDE